MIVYDTAKKTLSMGRDGPRFPLSIGPSPHALILSTCIDAAKVKTGKISLQHFADNLTSMVVNHILNNTHSRETGHANQD